ncbi:MAG: hypothetical protein ABW321_10965, partial [Polyangiales bacterium]
MLRLGDEKLGVRIELSPVACAEAKTSGCPFQLSAWSNGQLLSRQQLPLGLAVAPWVLDAAAPRLLDGTLDPLSPNAVGPTEFWQTGDETTSAGTGARLLHLAPDVIGILVDQVAGFEHVKRQHVLLALVRDELRLVWQFEEPSGPTWSTATLVRVGEQDEAVLLVSCGNYSGEEAESADECKTLLVRWDSATQKTIREPAASRAHAAVLGPFGSLT